MAKSAEDMKKELQHKARERLRENANNSLLVVFNLLKGATPEYKAFKNALEKEITQTMPVDTFVSPRGIKAR